jgi:hypothetical protein
MKATFNLTDVAKTPKYCYVPYNNKNFSFYFPYKLNDE